MIASSLPWQPASRSTARRWWQPDCPFRERIPRKSLHAWAGQPHAKPVPCPPNLLRTCRGGTLAMQVI